MSASCPLFSISIPTSWFCTPFLTVLRLKEISLLINLPWNFRLSQEASPSCACGDHGSKLINTKPWIEEFWAFSVVSCDRYGWFQIYGIGIRTRTISIIHLAISSQDEEFKIVLKSDKAGEQNYAELKMARWYWFCEFQSETSFSASKCKNFYFRQIEGSREKHYVYSRFPKKFLFTRGARKVYIFFSDWSCSLEKLATFFTF